MKNKNHLKVIFIFWTMAISSIFAEAIVQHTEAQRVKIQNNNLTLTSQLPIPRALIPRSIKEHVSIKKENFRKETNINIECNTSTSLCASFEGNNTLENVSSWIGFEFKDNTGNYFIATYGQKAKPLGERTYSTLKWDKQHLWLNIGKNTVPFPIQTRFVGIDKESTNEWHTVDYIGYRMDNAGINYLTYPDNMSTSILVLLINPKTKEVIKYHIEYYDENGEYIGDYQIKVGDAIESYFLGFEKEAEDLVYLFSIEDISLVTDPITFTHKEQYPGKDFNCTNCGELDLAQVEFKYMFEAYGETRSNFTKPLPLIDNNSNASTKKSVPISGTWILFFLIILIVIIKFKKNNISNETQL